MATLCSSAKSTYGSPYVYYTFTVSETSRTSSKVTLKFTVSSKLQYSSSSLSTGIVLSAGVYVGGSWHNWTIKSSGTTWSGTGSHSSSASFSISTAADTTKLSSIKVRVRRTDSYGSAGILSAKSISSGISIASSATFTIKYNANGGTGAPGSQTKSYGVTLKLDSTKPTRTSEEDNNTTTTYTFKGWGTSSTATSVAYKAGGNYTANKSATLYAVWAVGTITSYEIAYDVGDECTTVIPTQTKTKGTALTLSTTIPTRQGYTFSKWNTEEDGSGTSYSAGGTYSTDDDVTLYAIWTAGTHTVAFNANGGSGAPSSFTKTSGVNVTISETEPTLSGYDFRGWNTSASGTGRWYYSGMDYDYNQVGGTITLYAQWISTDILIYTNANCKAVLFQEVDDIVGFENTGTVMCPEFIEGSSAFKMSPSAIYVAELIEK